MIRLIAVFIVAFGLGAYASLHVLTDYVVSIKDSHKAAVRQGFETYKYANTKDLAPLIKSKRQLLGVLMRRAKAVRLWLDSMVEALRYLRPSLRTAAY